MARDAIAEWRRALMRRRGAYAAMTAGSSPREWARLRPPFLSSGEGRSADGIRVQPFDLSRTRPLQSAARFGRERSDLAAAIRVLQRHNRLLRARFGIGWVDATNFVLGESERRGTTATLLARTLSAQLRSEAAT